MVSRFTSHKRKFPFLKALLDESQGLLQAEQKKMQQKVIIIINIIIITQLKRKGNQHKKPIKLNKTDS